MYRKLLISFSVFLFSHVCAAEEGELLSISELRPATNTQPAMILTKLADSLKSKYCYATVLKNSQLQSVGYLKDSDNLAWKKTEFASGSELLIASYKSFGEWETSTLVDEESGVLNYKFAESDVDVVCESGGYYTGEFPIALRQIPLYSDTELTQETCQLPIGAFSGQAGWKLKGNYMSFLGPDIEKLCELKEVYGAFRIPVLTPRVRVRP